MQRLQLAMSHLSSIPSLRLRIGRRFPRKISKRISMPIRFSSCTHTMRWYRRFPVRAARKISVLANTAGVSASNVQSAIEQVQQQLSALALGSIPDGSITAVKLAASLQQQLDTIAQLQTTVEQMQTAEHASGTQFPFMILALSADTAETLKDELASAALGLHYTDGVHGPRQTVRLAVQQKKCQDAI